MSTDEPAVLDGGLVRVRLDLGYDGAGFSGWASQPGLRTVQGVLEETLRVVLRLPIPPSLTVAGRTDAGVHARGQVAHVDLPLADQPLGADPEAALAAVLPRLRGALPRDIRVHRAVLAPVGFDARFSALWRRYSYRVVDDPAGPDPLRRGETLAWGAPLDLELLNEASAELVGEWDFAAFCRRREGATTIRTLREFTWQRRPGEPDGAVAARVTADAFCHSMVRALVGCLLPVGDGRRPVGWPARVLAAGVRDSAVHVAPPYPLVLEEVGYPPAADLAEQALRTRRIRAVNGG
jgi:tRNA pseudouridine38-40 synthase